MKATPSDSLRAWVNQVRWDYNLTPQQIADILRGEAINQEIIARHGRQS